VVVVAVVCVLLVTLEVSRAHKCVVYDSSLRLCWWPNAVSGAPVGASQLMTGFTLPQTCFEVWNDIKSIRKFRYFVSWYGSNFVYSVRCLLRLNLLTCYPC